MEQECERFFFPVIIVHAYGCRAQRGMKHKRPGTDEIISEKGFGVNGYQPGSAYDLLVGLVNISFKAQVAYFADGKNLLDAGREVFVRAEFFLEQGFALGDRLKGRGGEHTGCVIMEELLRGIRAFEKETGLEKSPALEIFIVGEFELQPVMRGVESIGAAERGGAGHKKLFPAYVSGFHGKISSLRCILFTVKRIHFEGSVHEVKIEIRFVGGVLLSELRGLVIAIGEPGITRTTHQFSFVPYREAEVADKVLLVLNKEWRLHIRKELRTAFEKIPLVNGVNGFKIKRQPEREVNADLHLARSIQLSEISIGIDGRSERIEIVVL